MQRPDSYEAKWPIYAWTSGSVPATGAPPVGFAGLSLATVAGVDGFPVDIPVPGVIRYLYAWAFDTFAANIDVVNDNPLDAFLVSFSVNTIPATGNKLLPMKSVAGDGVRPRHVYFPIDTNDKILFDFQNVRDPATIDILHAQVTIAICPPEKKK